MGDACAVVGAGPGIGLAVARRFAREGHAVGLLSRSSRESEAAALGGVWQHTDADDPGSIRDGLDAVAARLGGPMTVLVWNVAMLDPSGGAADALTAAGLAESLAVEPLGTLTAIEAVAPAMRAAGSGTILVTGGGLAVAPQPAFARLAVSKAAVRALVLGLAPAYADAGIHLATVTVKGFVRPGSRFDPDRIAEAYWTLHLQDRADWVTEVTFDGR